MTIQSDINFGPNKNTDNKLLVSAAFNIHEGGYMSRDSALEIGHNNGEIVYHPTISGLIRSGENHLLTKGRIRIIYDLHDSVTPEHIENYITYITADQPNVRAIHEPVSNSIHVFYNISYTQDTFRELPAKYAPLSDKSKFMVSEGSDMFCFLRIDNEPEAWTVEYRDITNNATINKQGGLCYVIFSTAVSVNGNLLVPAKAYKVTSDTLEVTVSENTKVVRMYRD
jgi:hypothetical protein